MTKLIHLDIAALLILVIILISQFTRRMSKGTTNHFFIALVIMTVLSGAADIWAVVMDNDAAFFSSIYNSGYQYSDKHSVYYNLPQALYCQKIICSDNDASRDGLYYHFKDNIH